MIRNKCILKINEFEISVDDWNIENQFFWLRKDYDTWSMKIEDIKDLEEIIQRFKEKQQLTTEGEGKE